MIRKIKLKCKWNIGRNKVIKRYENFMRNFPEPVYYEDGEDWDTYTQRVLNHTFFICRCSRLADIAIRYYDKEILFLRNVSRILYLFTAFCIASYITWKILEVLR